ncbi:hypothetical protein [Xanthomonas axonopodis]
MAASLDSIARAHAIGIAAELRLQRAYRTPRRADRPQRCCILRMTEAPSTSRYDRLTPTAL